MRCTSIDFHLESALTLLGKVLEKRCSTAAWVFSSVWECFYNEVGVILTSALDGRLRERKAVWGKNNAPAPLMLLFLAW